MLDGVECAADEVGEQFGWLGINKCQLTKGKEIRSKKIPRLDSI